MTSTREWEAPSATFTGTTRGPVITDENTGEQVRAVYEWERGECVDRYVTIVRYTDARYGYTDA